jgi:hypothetical protein
MTAIPPRLRFVGEADAAVRFCRAVYPGAQRSCAMAAPTGVAKIAVVVLEAALAGARAVRREDVG